MSNETGLGGFFDSFETGMVYWSMKVVWETTLILSPAREWFQRFRPLSASESDCQSRCQPIATQKPAPSVVLLAVLIEYRPSWLRWQVLTPGGMGIGCAQPQVSGRR